MSKVHATLAALVVFACSFMLLPGVSLASGPIEPPPEIPEHPRPDKVLPPGFVTPEPPFEERIIWDEEKPDEAKFIPQAAFEKYSLDELPLSPKQKERLKGRIQMRRPLEGPPPHPWWRPMPECSWLRHGGEGSSPGPDAVGFAELILEHPTSFIGKVIAIVPGWHTTWNLVTNAVYYEVLEVLRDPTGSIRNGHVVATNTLRLDGELLIDGVEICTYGARDFRRMKVGETWLIPGTPTDAKSFFDSWLALPVEGGYVLPQPTGRLSEREPLALEILKTQIEAKEK